MEAKTTKLDLHVWLNDERSLSAPAIAAPLTMAISIVLLMVAVTLQFSGMVVIAWITAATSLGCHVWFALLRTKLIVALYQYLFLCWGNAQLEEVAPIRRRARSLAIGAIGSWSVTVMQGLTLVSFSSAYNHPMVITVFAIVLAVSSAYSTGFIYGRKALALEVERVRDVPPACRVHL